MPVKETRFVDLLVSDTIKAMVQLAGEENVTAKQKLNGVTVLANGDSDADLIFRDQQRAQLGYVASVFGPYTTETLSEEVLANDARIAAEDEMRAEERRAQRAAKHKTIERESKTVYRAMIYAGIAILHFYRDDFDTAPEKVTLVEVADRNKDLLKRVSDEVVSTFNYRLSHHQIGSILNGYLANSKSITDTEPYVLS